MAAEQLPSPCWMAESRSEDEPGGHWPTRSTAEGAALLDGHKAPKVTQLATPCWVVICDGDCNEHLEDEEYGHTLHGGNRAEVEQWADADDWVVTRDGRTFCPEDAPDLDPVELAVIEQVPGQLTIDQISGEGDLLAPGSGQ